MTNNTNNQSRNNQSFGRKISSAQNNLAKNINIDYLPYMGYLSLIISFGFMFILELYPKTFGLFPIQQTTDFKPRAADAC